MLKLIQEKTLNSSGESFITKYSNDMYTVFLIEDGDDLDINVIKSDFKMPSIDVFGCNEVTVNIAATGSLSGSELTTHLKNVLYAHETLNEIEYLIKNYKFE